MAWYEYVKELKLSRDNTPEVVRESEKEFMQTYEVGVVHCYKRGVFLSLDLPYYNEKDDTVYSTGTELNKEESQELIDTLQEAMKHL